MTETTLDTINGNDRIESTLSQGTNVTRSQLIPSDQLYRQAKIYEENRLTRGGELPEGAAESGNEDNDHDAIVGKNKKYDPHRALNIDLSEKPIQSITTSPPLLTSQLKEPVPKQIETPPILTGKPKKSKKKKIIEKQSSTLKSKHKRERSDYKELLSPADEEENCPTSTLPPPAIAKKPKKKKSSLFPHSQNYTHIYFSINAISFSQKLKTTLTYSINKSNIIETDRIEFKLNLPCSQYLRRKTIDSIALADLMSSGVLICQSQLRISSSNQDFLLMINTICQSYRLTVVEKINSAASLYA
ncbi:unnamed protein product [Rotaria sordida]|uniref:AP-3 complex subunit delta Mu C-terminal domain-containing protein n=2 Tax=Rotaria sordida TaxID=392033 RepID=A0A820CUG0_9BILA|nr:unnamed protein product [Rotaria sordida]